MRLRTLGGLSLVNDGLTLEDRRAAAFAELTRRRRKLALLAVLVRAPRPLSRDLLTDMFWPDEEPARARHSLNDALSHLRRVLGTNALGARGGDVALAPTAPLWCDAAAFDAAVAAGDAMEVISLYDGPFLDGVYLDKVPRFEEWSDRQREPLRRAFIAACAEYCKVPLTTDNAGAVADVARRWLDAAPESSAAARRWLLALAAPDTRDALRSATDAYARVCRDLNEQFDAGPDETLAALGTELRERLAAQLDAAVAAHPVEPVLAVPRRADGPNETPDPTAPTPPTPTPHRGSRPRVAVVMVLAAAALTAILTAVRRDAARPDAEDTRPWLLVAASPPATGTDSAQLQQIVTLAIETTLAADASLDVLPPGRIRTVLRLMGRADSSPLDEATAAEIAARTGVGFIVVPSLLQVGSRFTVSARVLAANDGDVVATVLKRANSADELLEMADALVAEISRLVRRAPSAERRGPSLPLATTASLPALQHFATATAAEYRSDWETARGEYQSATAADSLFALAWLRLGVLEYQLNRGLEGERAFARALQLSERISPRERAFLRANVYRWRRQSDSAIAVMQAWLVVNPHDRQSRSAVAYDLLLARRHAEAQAAYRALLATDSLDANAWVNLASSAAATATPSSLREAQQAYARAFALWPAGRTDATLNHEWGAAWAAAGATDSAAAIFSLMLAGPSGQRVRGLRSLGHLAVWNGHFAEAARRFAEVVALEVADERWLGVVRARLLLASALEQSGDSLAALAQLDSARRLATHPDVQEPVVLYWLGKALVRRGRSDAARTVLRATEARVQSANVRHRAATLLLSGELLVAEGRTAEGLVRVDSGAALDSTAITLDSRAYATVSHGVAARDRATLEHGAQLYAALAQRPRFGWEGTLPQLLASVHAGLSYERVGDATRARAAFEQFVTSHRSADRDWPALAIARAGMAGSATPEKMR
jgi:DNA-binding SARP family transcriptional activator/tetratricopeptide (TPR) repeat protein